ncbi:hypothetical protein SDC9_74368 [bioreactor metagenome]|uniref:Uncharacterized protein n=1 Tax=bioreactor metagenome TaxID=1076179 RepID=A0A644YMX1_9ZZZZ
MLVGKHHLCAAVKVRQLAQTPGDDVKIHLHGFKHALVRHERNRRALLARSPELGQRRYGFAGDDLARFVRFTAKLYAVEPPVRADLDLKPFGERVDHRSANAVEPAGIAVGIVAELAARVELGKHDLHAGNARLFVNLHGNAAAVVGNGHGVVLMQRHGDFVGVAVGGFVDGVVDDFPEEVMQAALSRGADVHARTHANRVQPLHDFDFIYRVVRCHTNS